MFARILLLLAAFAAVPATAETITVHAGDLITDPSRPEAGSSTITIVDGRISAAARW